MRCVVLPVVWVGQLSWFGQIVEAVDARGRLAHGFAVKASAIKVGQLLPVVLFILIWVIVVGTHYIIQRFSVGLLWLRSPAEEAERDMKTAAEVFTAERQQVWVESLPFSTHFSFAKYCREHWLCSDLTPLDGAQTTIN